MQILESLILVVGVFGSAVAIVYILARYNYLIKKTIAENGGNADPDAIKFSYRDIGCIILSLGIGLGVSSIYTTMKISEDMMDMLIYATILVCGGLGLITAHYMRDKIDED